MLSKFIAPRRLEKLCWLVAVALGFLQAWGRRHYSADGVAYMGADGISYLDIGDAYWRGDWAAAVNAMWSPFYSWLTGLALRLFQPSPYNEFTVIQLLNFTLYLVSLASFVFFLRELKRFRDMRMSNDGVDRDGGHERNFETLPEWAWLIFAYAIFVWTSLSMNRVARTSPDVLVSALVFNASALLLRIRTRRAGWLTFALFGLTLGLGYLSKTFMFPLAFVFLASSLFATGNLRRAAPRVALALVVFLAVAAPFIVALSRAKGRPTIGDTARLNYAWHVNGAQIFIHWQGEPGAPHGTPAHPTRKLLDSPAVYEFASPVAGTYPPWYDPTYWHEGLTARVSLTRQLKTVARNALLAYQFLFYRFFPAAVAACLFILFYVSRRTPRELARDASGYLFLLAPALVASGFYLLVHFEQRYFAPFVVVIGMSLFASVRLARSPDIGRLVAALVIFTLAMFTLSVGYYSARDLSSTIRDLLAPGRAARRDVQWQVADELRRMKIAPGDKVASIGNTMFHAWPRLARVRVVAEISRRTGDEVEKFWAGDAALKNRVMETFAGTGAKVVVAEGIPPWAAGTEGWQRIGMTNYFVYPVSHP
jgi:4-amino-4-deoxy-L-arabinose transferase-like glycosyltransferase